MVRSLVALLAIASTASAFLLPAAPNKLAASSATVMHASRDRGLQDRRVQLERVALAGLGITMVPAMPAFADRCVRVGCRFVCGMWGACSGGVLEWKYLTSRVESKGERRPEGSRRRERPQTVS